jgi:hypothetical protein
MSTLRMSLSIVPSDDPELAPNNAVVAAEDERCGD